MAKWQLPFRKINDFFFFFVCSGVINVLGSLLLTGIKVQGVPTYSRAKPFMASAEHAILLHPIHGKKDQNYDF